MSRKIKFRAWDTLTNRMYYTNGGMENYTIEKLNIFHYTNDLHTKVMQFTGLTDKNGKEIYEGDILTSSEGILLVIWDEIQASFALSKSGWMYNHYFGEAVVSEKCEVIGNIYETPDLLGDKP